jgi:hypothetical protein
VISRSSVEQVKKVDKQTDEMKLQLQTFDEEVKQRLKLEDLVTDGDIPDPHKWADLLDVDPDFREEYFRVYQSDEIKDTDEEPSLEISDLQFLNMELALPSDDVSLMSSYLAAPREGHLEQVFHIFGY